MSMVIFPCHRCGAEIYGVAHTKQDCDDFLRESEESAKRWRELTRNQTATKGSVGLKLPAARVVKPSSWK